MRGSKFGAVIALAALVAACVAPSVNRRVARVCDPQTDTTCHPTANTKVVVK
jgi:hypothetical protein